MKISLQLLGTGASMGVPVVGCSCATCRSRDPKNKRLRTSALLTAAGAKLLIDAGPDLRQQLLRWKVGDIDGLFLTHTHFDHIGGLDDLRIFSLRRAKALPCLLSEESFKELQKRYYYLFSERAKQEESVVRLDWQVIGGGRSEVKFVGLPLNTFSYEQLGMRVDGFRAGDIAYVTDIKTYSDAIFEELQGLKVLVLGTIRPGSSQMHLTFEEALLFAKRVGAKKTYFVHMAHEVEHREQAAFLKERVGDAIELGYDGLVIEVE